MRQPSYPTTSFALKRVAISLTSLPYRPHPNSTRRGVTLPRTSSSSLADGYTRYVEGEPLHESYPLLEEELLGQRIKGPGRTTDQLRAKFDVGIGALALGGQDTTADAILAQFDRHLTQLARSTVMLMYQEHTYLHLSGIQGGRSVRRHLSRGLHLIFSSQDHRRADRTVDAWLAQSDTDHEAGPYHFADTIPPPYAAARSQQQSFRLADPDAVRRYVSDLRATDQT